MSHLMQFDAGYHPKEDRILLRVTNSDEEEYRLWLTRRMTGRLLNEFKPKTSAYRIAEGFESDAMEPGAPEPPRGPPDASTLIKADLSQQAAAARQDFSSPFKGGRHFPLGKEGVVIASVDFHPDGKGPGNHALCFHAVTGGALSIGVSANVFNSIFEVLERVTRKADWGLISTVQAPGRMRLQ